MVHDKIKIWLCPLPDPLTFNNVGISLNGKKTLLGSHSKKIILQPPKDKIFSPDKFHRVQSLDDLSLSVCIVLGEKLVLSKSQPCP